METPNNYELRKRLAGGLTRFALKNKVTARKCVFEIC